MRPYIKTVCLCAAIVVTSPAVARETAALDISTAIRAQVARVYAASTPELRQKAGQDLFTLTGNKDPRTIDDAAIDAMAALINDDPALAYEGQGMVAASAAAAIGNLGPRAQRAAPALIRAIAAKHRDVGQPLAGLHEAAILCSKLQNITFDPLPQDCDWWLHGKLPEPDAVTRLQALKPLPQ